MATTQYNQLAIAYKKLSGKSHTSVNFDPGNETIGSGVQISALQTFGQDVSTTTAVRSTALGNTSTNASGETVVQYVRFTLTGIGTSLVATGLGNVTGNTSIDDTGNETAAASLYHAYALSLPSDYESNSAYAHTKRGTFPFKANQSFSGSNGRLQVIPARFASGSIIDQFDPKVLESNVTTEITPGDPIDWVFDPFAGVLYVQDPSSTKTPGFIEGYLYIGNYVDEVINSIEGGGGGSGNYISSSNGNNIVSASNENILVQGDYTTTAVTIVNLSTTSASFGVPVVATSFTGSLQGTGSWSVVAVSASITDNTSTNASYYPVFVTASGSQALTIDTNTLSYNPSTNILTTTASSALTASNISTAFVGSIVAPNNQILISNGTGQVTGSGLLSFNPAVDGGQLTIGAVTIDENSFNSTNNAFTFNFGSSLDNYIEITNANNPNAALITFNLSASFTGDTTFVNANNSVFDDQFILLASGSAAGSSDLDSGIVFEYGDQIGTGSALFFDAFSTKRLAFRYSASISDTNMTPQSYITTTFVHGVGSINSTSDVDNNFTNAGGLATNSHGLMFIDDVGNIYIKS
jgi:hypothetical protein